MSLTPHTKRTLRRTYKFLYNGRPDWLAERWSTLQRYRACTRDGKIGLIRDGRDCDCVSYHRELIVEAVPFVQFMREERHHEHWLDGPESTTIVPPDQIDPCGDFSRDLALEAFEDGHPHVVYDRSAY